MNKWRNDFSQLLNGENINYAFDETFLENTKCHKENLESLMLEDDYVCNAEVNSAITMEELERLFLNCIVKKQSVST